MKGAYIWTRVKVSDFIVASSLANLAFLLVWFELLYVPEADQYWIVTRSVRSYTAALLNWLLLTLLYLGGAAAYRGTSRRWIRSLLRLLFLASLLTVLNYIRLALGLHETALDFLRDNHAIGAGVALILLLAAVGLSVFNQLAARMLYVVLLCLAPFALLNLTRCVWAIVDLSSAASVSAHEPSPAVAAASAVKHRVVWIIFDELDQGVLFSHRPPSIELPEFDRLRRESWVASNAMGLETSTVMGIPSYLSGRRLADAVPAGDTKLLVRFEDDAEVVDWRHQSTLFSEAFMLGAQIQIVGYYHPYCRLFSGLYEKCSRRPLLTVQLESTDSFAEIVLGQIYSMIPTNVRRNGVLTFERSLVDASEAVSDPDTSLAYVHVSVPHRPYIYDRESGSLTQSRFSKTGYYDNLALADLFLGEIRRAMESAGLWDLTALVITSDHGYREAPSLGIEWDPRVPFLVRLPGSSVGAEYSTKFSSIVAKDLILAVLTGELNDQGQIATWIAGRPEANSRATSVKRVAASGLGSPATINSTDPR